MGRRMQFGWDEPKSRRNEVERGLPFWLAPELFQNPVEAAVDHRRDYGEIRIRAYGRLRGRLPVCVYTDRLIAGREVRWIISLRKANAREVRAYHEHIEAKE